jgi:cbb3-type cytochrome c oxidase subunit III
MTREDVLAVRAYLDTLPPAKSQRPEAKLTWPLGYRSLMRGWNWMFFREGTYQADPEKSAEWNRGAYLVEGPGHCGACHTPKNLAGADKKDRRLTGGEIQHWFAPNLTRAERFGIGSWTNEEVVEYLKTGRNAHSGAAGLMAEVVADSTSKLSKDDLKAIAVYLKSTPNTVQVWNGTPDHSSVELGRQIFAASCAGCHRNDGTGVPRMFPPLAHNANLQSVDPLSIIRIILQGAQTVPTAEQPTSSTMPAYNWKLSDTEIAAVASYVRNAWGNSAPEVNADQVKRLRENLSAKSN